MRTKDRVPRTRVALSPATLKRGLRFLSDRDPDIAQIIERHGPPPLWAREPGFATLVRIILEQQVSLASAKAAFERLLVATAPFTPRRFLRLSDSELKLIGFSRQKVGYCRGLAERIAQRSLSLEALATMDDDEVRAELIKVKGIGGWTADIYILMALRRPDVWPSGDLALAVAVQRVKNLPVRPTQCDLDYISVKWQPWRAVAARVLWHYYLSGGRLGSASTQV